MTTVTQNDQQSRTLLTVNQFCARNQFITPSALRFQIFDAEQNGLKGAKAILRVGRKVLIDEPKYFDWIDGQQEGGEGCA